MATATRQNLDVNQADLPNKDVNSACQGQKDEEVDDDATPGVSDTIFMRLTNVPSTHQVTTTP